MTKDSTSDTKTSFFEEIYQKNYDKLVNYSISYTNDIEASKEVVQDAFMKYFIIYSEEKFPTYEHTRSWLYKTVLNMSLNRARENERTQSIGDKQLSTKSAEGIYFEKFEETEHTKAINELIQSLTKELKELFVIYYIRELSHKEAAKELNISECSSKAKKSRLGKTCREFFKKAGYRFNFQKEEGNDDGSKK